MMGDCPCHHCSPPDRGAGCHDTCKAYLEWSAEHRVESAKLAAKRINEYVAAEPMKPKRIMRK